MKSYFPHLVIFILYCVFAAICIQKEEVVYRIRRLQMARWRSRSVSEGDHDKICKLHKICTPSPPKKRLLPALDAEFPLVPQTKLKNCDEFVLYIQFHLIYYAEMI